MGTATPASPTAINVTTVGTAVTLTETVASGYVLTAASCTDANSAVTGNTGSIGSLSGSTLTIPSGNVVAGADFTCVFTNRKIPTVKVQKITTAGAGGPFTFSVTNLARHRQASPRFRQVRQRRPHRRRSMSIGRAGLPPSNISTTSFPMCAPCRSTVVRAARAAFPG